MKKLLIAALILGLASAAMADTAKKKTKTKKKSAQVTATYAAPVKKEIKQDIFLNPFGLIFGVGNIGYEHVIGKNASLVGNFDFASYSVLTAYGISGSYRFWINNKKKLQGFFAGPAIGLLGIKYDWGSYYVWDGAYGYTTKDYTSTYTVFEIGAQGGYQWIFTDHIMVNLGLDLSYWAGSFDTPYSGYAGGSFKYSGLMPSLIGTIGYAF